MLIVGADIDGTRVDVRIAGERIAAIGALAPSPGEAIIDACGGALLPGLHDNHIHLFALAARQASVSCGPPDVHDIDDLGQVLRGQGQGRGWLRGTGYHESVAGLLDAATLDRIGSNRPVRIQHRGGRMWFLNSAALDELLATAEPPPGLERAAGRFTGHLFDEDAWLRTALGGTAPDLTAISAMLAGYGITGVTDMSPANDPAVARHLAGARDGGALLQTVHLAGSIALGSGPYKIHLHEAALPDHDQVIAAIRRARQQDRPVAVHCTTEVELVFALSAIAAAGPAPGDRIEHASIAPDHLVEEMARMGLAVVVQPNFVRERGDSYLADVPAADQPALYRLRSLKAAGLALAGGCDAPFGLPDPWAAMAAAVDRRTRAGAKLGAGEALDPEGALSLFLAQPDALDRRRRIMVGARADLCLLDRPWRRARAALAADLVRITMIGGSIVHDRVDQAPGQRGLGADARA